MPTSLRQLTFTLAALAAILFVLTPAMVRAFVGDDCVGGSGTEICNGSENPEDPPPDDDPEDDGILCMGIEDEYIVCVGEANAKQAIPVGAQLWTELSGTCTDYNNEESTEAGSGITVTFKEGGQGFPDNQDDTNSNGAAGVTYYQPIDAAGIFVGNFSASADDYGSDTEKIIVKVVEVQKLEPDEGENIDTIQTGSEDIDTEVWVVEYDSTSGATFDVTATPNPPLTDQQLTDTNCWSLAAYHSDADGTQGSSVSGAVQDNTTVELPKDSTGSYLVVATAGESEKRVLAHVVDIDIQMQGLPEETGGTPHEEDPGAVVQLNDDDDNNNVISDLYESGTITNENDLVSAGLTVSSSLSSGTLKLEANSGNSKIKIWENVTKGTEITLPKTWTLGTDDIPSEVYVEGVDKSTSIGDVELKLTYQNGDTNISDSVVITVYDIKLKEVSFSGADYHEITEDGSGNTYSAPHWQDNDTPPDNLANEILDRRYPVSYRRNRKMKVEAKIEVSPADPNLDWKIRGDGQGNLDIPETTASISGTTVSIAATEATNAFPDSVQFYGPHDSGDPLEISWSISWDNGDTWHQAGISDNRVYVLLDDPQANALYETLVDIACRNAEGKSDPTDVVSAIWLDFSSSLGNGVKRKLLDGHNISDGIEMTYWNPAASAQDSLAQMLGSSSGSGTCVAWSQLFHETLDAVGITGSTIYEITPNTTVVPGAIDFLVKNWNFGHHIHTGSDGIQNSNVVGDDLLVIPTGAGSSEDNDCILPGTNGTIDSTAVGDDDNSGQAIDAGNNGICETTAVGDDVQIIAVGNGRPDSIGITPGANGTLDSLVNTNDVSQDGFFNGNPYPYLLYGFNIGGDPQKPIGSAIGDAAPQDGIAGQHNSSPPEIFGNHFVVKYSGKIYDPSYGAGPFSSEELHENNALDGFLSIVSGPLVVAKKADPNTQELVYSHSPSSE